MEEEQEPPNRMASYILRRLLWLPVILLIVSFVTFVLGRYGPGDPVQVLMGQHSNPAVVERIREQRGLNDPIVVQYVRYLRNVTRGDFGESFKYRGRTVAELLGNKMWVSVQLNVTALIISFGLGVPIGLFAALRQRSLWDTVAISVSLFGQAVPIFLTAPGLLLIFALWLDLLPTHGWGGVFDTRAILPGFAMGIPGVAIIARLTRSSTLEVIGSDYIRTARAKGLPEMVVQRRHILRNAMIPVATYLGFSLSGLLTTSFIVERFFGIPGVGNLLIEAVFARDYPVINGVLLITTTVFVMANLLVDLVYPVLDPRIRLGQASVA